MYDSRRAQESTLLQHYDRVCACVGHAVAADVAVVVALVAESSVVLERLR